MFHEYTFDLSANRLVASFSEVKKGEAFISCEQTKNSVEIGNSHSFPKYTSTKVMAYGFPK